jgi:hypothetical protein
MARRAPPDTRRLPIPALAEPFDLLFVVRFDEDYVVEEALEAPRAANYPLFAGRSFVWSRALLALEGVRHIPGDQLRIVVRG